MTFSTVGEATDASFDQLLGNARFTVAYFTAPWCGPCRALAPLMTRLAAELPDIQFLKINVDENQGLAGRWRIMSVPTLLFFSENGTPVAALTGLQPEPALRAWLHEHSR